MKSLRAKLILPLLLLLLVNGGSTYAGSEPIYAADLVQEDPLVGARTESFWTTRPGGYIETTRSGGYDLLINGTNHYINFGTNSGSLGYGFRDNGGSMEFKDSGGAWTDFGSIAGMTDDWDFYDANTITPSSTPVGIRIEGSSTMATTTYTGRITTWGELDEDQIRIPDTGFSTWNISNEGGRLRFKVGTATVLRLNSNSVEPRQSILPDTDNAYDVGDATHQFNDLYLAGIINMPSTSSATAGVVQLNSERFLHGFGNVGNIFAGYQAGNFTMSGATDNAGFGRATLQALTSGDDNFAMGSYALDSLTTGSRNTAMGKEALQSLTTTNNNTGVGYSALTNTTASDNTAVGRNAGERITSGSNNTFLGSLSGQDTATGQTISNATAIGYNSQVGCSDCLVLGNGAFVGIGTSNPSVLLDLGLAGTTAGQIRFAGSTSGNATIKTAAAAGTNIQLQLPITSGTLALENSDIRIQDADGDTMVQVEESADEDNVRIDVGGVEVVNINNDSVIQGTFDFNADLLTDSGGGTHLSWSGSDASGTATNVDQYLTWDGTDLFWNWDVNYGFGGVALNLRAPKAGGGFMQIDGTDFRPLGTSTDLGTTGSPFQSAFFNTDVNLQSDTGKLFLGAGSDASLTYNGTNLVINPQEVGSGVVSFSGDAAFPLSDANNRGIFFGLNNDVKIYHTDTTAQQEKLIINPRFDGGSGYVQIGDLISNNAPNETNDNLASMKVVTDSAGNARAGLFVSEYSVASTATANNMVGINAGAIFTNTGGSTNTSAAGNTAGRYFVRSSAANTVAKSSALSAQTSFTTGTLTEGVLMRLEPFTVTTGTITAAYGLKFEGASKSSSGTFTDYYGIYMPYSDEGTTSRPTNYYNIFFARDTGLGTNTNRIHFGEKNTNIFSPNTNILGFNVATGGSYDWRVNNSTEITLAADTLTFNSGSTDPVLNWATDGHLSLTTGKFAVTDTAVTLGVGATTFAATSNVMTVTGDALANVIATITGDTDGMMLTLIFADALVTITDDATAAADTINLSAAFVSTANDTLTLIHDGTSWREVARSVN